MRQAHYFLALLALVSTSAAAQLRPGTLLEDGRIVVKIFVTMPDPSISAGQPIPHVRLLLSSPENRYTVSTDGAGTATTFALPGSYRVATLDSVDWRGRRYRWDLPLDVRPGMAVLDLTPTNAASSEPISLTAARAASGEEAPAAATPSAPRRVGLSPKDPGTAQVLSFLITGLGQVYAGEAGKGLTLLLAGTTATVVAVSSLSCSSIYGCDDDGEATAAIFLIGALGLWIYSIADADDAVDRWNARHGLVSRSTPVVAARNGQTLLGFSVAY